MSDLRDVIGRYILEYTISRCTRRCSLSDRPLEPGEWFYSVVVESGDDLKRIDIAQQKWTGPPEGSLGWWKTRMPMEISKKLKPAPDAVLIETLSHFCEQPGKSDLAFLLAVLLVRRHLLEEVPVDEESKDPESPVWHLVNPSDRSEFYVPRAWPAPNRVSLLQQQLIDLLYCEA